MNEIKVSIITPSFQSSKTIRDTLESILRQTYGKIEYILIDGGSTDGTLEIAKQYEEKFLQKGYEIQIFSEKDAGIYDGMNKGIAKASGEIVGIINSDDWYEDNAIERVVQTYHETKFDMFYADLRMWSQKDDQTWKEKLIKHARYRKLAVSRDWNHPTTFIRRSVYQQYHYKLESLHDDWDLVLRIRKAGYKIVVLPEVLANFRMNGTSHERKLAKVLERVRARYRIYRNNGYSRWYLADCILIEVVKWIAG